MLQSDADLLALVESFLSTLEENMAFEQRRMNRVRQIFNRVTSRSSGEREIVERLRDLTESLRAGVRHCQDDIKALKELTMTLRSAVSDSEDASLSAATSKSTT